MNRDRIEGLLKQATGTLMEHWGRLTSDRITIAEGRCERQLGQAQARRGSAKEEAGRQLREFRYRNRLWNTSGHQ